ncbi:unnamed protein product [Gongylonema pulchrum]|uniref:Uncharacterized protein n=1 Tax=Gongylonema pulchrum TaxID=637853 RepID=A0A183D7S2_9BILA|nr:unnamed protein product [Gongylonema pulchrum]
MMFYRCKTDVAKSSVDSKSSAISTEDIHRLTGKIATLENEKFVFATQLKLARNKLENLELLEAQKKILEDRVVILNDMNDCLVVRFFFFLFSFFFQ